MARDIPQSPKGKMPSLTMISIGKGKQPAEDGAPKPDESAESNFKCPECGASLCAESKAEGMDRESPGEEEYSA